VSTQSGGLADSIIDPDRNPDKQPTALAVDVRDPQGIARQVQRFLSNTEEREQIIRNAREFAKTRYNSATIEKAMRERVFNKLFKS
ncbi:MAG: glycosyltransferase, partial [Patescibacteria group bacterium]